MSFRLMRSEAWFTSAEMAGFWGLSRQGKKEVSVSRSYDSYKLLGVLLCSYRRSAPLTRQLET